MGLSLYWVAMDPLQAAATLANPRIDSTDRVEASPNYVFGFQQNRPKFAPWNAPQQAAELIPAQLAEGDLDVEVVDTGWASVSIQSTELAGHLRTVLNPFNPVTVAGGPAAIPTVTEILEGPAAGHGTFIVNLLHRLLPTALITAAAIPPRFSTDDAFVPPDGTGPVSIRDDAAVTFAMVDSLTRELAGNLDYLNLSFGTYGCSEAAAALDAEAPDPTISFFAPLGMRRVLDRLAKSTSAGGAEDPPAQVFAAAGNDAQRPKHPVLFFPAAWAPQWEWLHSVASDPYVPTPPGTTEDYSNRGPWVEAQAAGTNVVSLLPARTTGEPEGWYRWSGTSFATPCALATHAAGTFVNGVYVPNGYVDIVTDPTTFADATAGAAEQDPYMDCGVNRPPPPGDAG